MHFDGAFARQGTGAGVVLTTPTGDKLYYVVQLCFGRTDKVSNNIAEYERLITGLRAAIALGVRHIIIKGDSQLLVNFFNKKYKPKDEHMAAYLEEVRKIEKRFMGMELQHIPHSDNSEADEIAKRASRREPQIPGIFEEWLLKPSATPLIVSPAVPREDLPPTPPMGASDYGPSSGAHLLLALEPQPESWTTEMKAYLEGGALPKVDAEAERVVHQAALYHLKEGDLYCHRPNGVALRCISKEQGRELLADIHGGDCGHHSSSRTLVGKAFRSGF
jgi:ribonuclease HI